MVEYKLKIIYSEYDNHYTLYTNRMLWNSVEGYVYSYISHNNVKVLVNNLQYRIMMVLHYYTAVILDHLRHLKCIIIILISLDMIIFV